MLRLTTLPDSGHTGVEVDHVAKLRANDRIWRLQDTQVLRLTMLPDSGDKRHLQSAIEIPETSSGELGNCTGISCKIEVQETSRGWLANLHEYLGHPAAN